MRTPSKTVPVKTRITPHMSPRPNFGPEQDKVHNLYLSHLHSLRRQLVAESLTCGQRCVALRHSIERARPMTRILSVPLQFAFGAKTLRASRRIQALATLFEGSHRRGALCTSGDDKEEPQKPQKPATKCETLHHNSAALAARFGLLLLRALNLGLAKQSAEKGTECTTNQKHYSHGNHGRFNNTFTEYCIEPRAPAPNRTATSGTAPNRTEALPTSTLPPPPHLTTHPPPSTRWTGGGGGVGVEGWRVERWREAAPNPTADNANRTPNRTEP